MREETSKKPSKRKSKVPWWNRPPVHKFGLALIVVVGLVLLSARAWDWVMWQESQGWKAHNGEVVRIAKPRPSASKAKPKGGFGAPRTAEAKWAIFTYTYMHKGKKYTSTKVSYAISGESIPLDWMGDLPSKGKASVYVNPKDPTLSVLRVGDDFEYWNLRMAIGLFMVIGGGIRLVYKLTGI